MKPEKEKDNTKKLIVIFSISILILIGLVVAGTYAFFTTNVIDQRGDSNTTLKTATLKEFGLEDGITSGGNLIPGDHITKTFSVTNQGSGPITYNLVWKSVTNTFVNKSDLIVTLTRDGSSLISESDNVIVPNTTTGSTVALKSNLTIAPKATQNFTLTITYRNTSSDQTADMGKGFSASLAIE